VSVLDGHETVPRIRLDELQAVQAMQISVPIRFIPDHRPPRHIQPFEQVGFMLGEDAFEGDLNRFDLRFMEVLPLLDLIDGLFHPLNLDAPELHSPNVIAREPSRQCEQGLAEDHDGDQDRDWPRDENWPEYFDPFENHRSGPPW
jgi:hypothetical protein